MILHIFNYDKFTEPYIEFIDKNFDINQHIFFIVGDSEYYINKNRKNVIMSDGISSIPFIISKMNSSDKIIIHGLFNRKILLILFSQPWLLKKCNWVIWGGDLYCYREERNDIKSKIFEKIRSIIIKDFGEITTLVKGDYDLAKQYYNILGKYHEGIYVNPIKIDYLDNIKKNIKKNSCINIQIGNSADKSNQHIEVIDLLSKYKNENIIIYAPLSYGDKIYAEKVKKYGEEVFGDKFKAILTYMNAEKYGEFLGNIDIAIFNNNRQQALGNIFALAYLGANIYVRNDTSMWKELCEYQGYKFKDVGYIYKESFDEFIKINENDIRINKKLSKNRFDENYMVNLWRKIF